MRHTHASVDNPNGHIVSFASNKVNHRNQKEMLKSVQSASARANTLSPRVQEALREDSDAVQSLSDIRGLLIGPISRLNEARMEEMLSILEEADRENKISVRELHARSNELQTTTEQIKLDVTKTNEVIKSEAAQQSVNLLTATQDMDYALKELAQKLENNFQKLSTELNHSVNALATKMASDHETLFTSVSKRIDDLTKLTVSNDERIVANFENKLAVSEVNMKTMRSREFDNLAEGFAEFSERMLKLRNARIM